MAVADKAVVAHAAQSKARAQVWQLRVHEETGLGTERAEERSSSV